MGFFTKKKSKDPLNRLSENEIQKKLYGEFEETGEINTPDIELRPREKREPVAVPTPRIEPQQKDESDLFSGVEETPVESDSEIDYDDHVLPEGPELENHTEIPPFEATREPVAEEEEDEDEEEEEELTRPPLVFKPQQEKVVKPATNVVAAPSTKKETGTFKKHSKPFGEKLKSGLTAFFAILQQGLGKGLFWLLSGLKSVFQFVYVKRKFFKKIGIALLVVGLLYALFSSVHYLNVQREEAMTAEKSSGAAESASGESAQSEAGEVAEKSAPVAVETAAESAAEESASVAEVSESSTPVEPILASNPEGRFVVQIATYVTEADAQRVIDQFTQAGWPSFIKEFSRTSGRVYYSVFLGRFSTFQEATDGFAKFKESEVAKPFTDAFVRSLSL